jgi:MFS family permease
MYGGCKIIRSPVQNPVHARRKLELTRDYRLACRFILGIIEAAFFPGALFYLSLFYNRKQFALRTALLYAGSQLGNAFGGLFAIAILKLEGVHGIDGWRWLFIIEGVATIALAIGFAFLLPNSTKSMRSLSDVEREYLLYTYAADQGQEDNASEITAGQGFIMAARDPKTWLLMGILYCCYIDGAVVNFFPSVVSTLGYSRNLSLILTAPPYLLCVVCMLINGWHSDKKQERYLHIVLPLSITLVAMVIAVSTLSTGARYAAMMLMPASFYSAAIVILSWITGSMAQPAVKRAVAISFINAVCNTPNVSKPEFIPQPQSQCQDLTLTKI